MAELTSGGLADAYTRGAGAWAAGPDRLYERLGDALVSACPPLAGRRVLDIGAGTGALSRAIDAAGGEVVATDLAVGMLTHRGHLRPPAVAADATCLPFDAAVFDAALAAFVLNHLPDPTEALREAARVTRSAGVVAAATFDAAWSHPAKEVVDAVAARFGYRRPRWYATLKASTAPVAGDPDALSAAASHAGLIRTQTRYRTVDGGLEGPHAVVAWRLGMAHLASFMGCLPADQRRRLVDAAVDAVGPEPAPVRPRLVILTAQVP